MGQRISGGCGWHRQRFGGTVHRAYSLARAGRLVLLGHNTQGTPLFYPVTIHNIRLYLRQLILEHLRERPCVGSAIAIGHYHVLNGAPTGIALKGLDALEEMPCDWTVVILEQAMTDPERRRVVRQRAVSKVRSLLLKAVTKDYRGISPSQVREQCRIVRRAVGVSGMWEDGVLHTIDNLCSHLSQAIEDGFFGRLPTE